MNKIECITNNKNLEIILENYKILFGSNHNDSYDVYKCFKNYFNKTAYSEYYKENNMKNLIKFNEHYVDIKNTLFFEIGIDFDFISDSKLGTKSLLLKYLEYTLEGIEYDESFNTIKELLYSLINFEIIDRVDIDLETTNFTTQCSDFNFKSLLKYIVPCLCRDNLEVNNMDLTYQEIITFQIEIINKIAKLCKTNIFIIGNLPYITNKILKKLDLLEKNIYFIIFSNQLPSETNIDNIIFTDLEWLDFLNEMALLDYMLELPFTYDILSFKNKIKENLDYTNIKNLLFKK